MNNSASPFTGSYNTEAAFSVRLTRTPSVSKWSTTISRRLMTSAYLAAPSIAPSRRLSHPSETASISRVSSEATSRNSNGTSSQMATKASPRASPTLSVTCENTSSATWTYSALATSNPATRPSSPARQLTEEAFHKAQHGTGADEDKQDDVESGHRVMCNLSQFQSAKIHCFA